MAPILSSHGHRVVAYDIDSIRHELAMRAGFARDADDVASQEIVIFALRGPSDVRAVAAQRFAAGALAIDTTSIDPQTAIDASRMVGERGASYLEAPVLGGPPQVGRWVFLFGGDPASVQRATAVLAPLGNGDHFGEVGRGAEAKLLNNILTGVHAAAVAEVVRVALKRNVDVAALQRAIMRSESAGRNPVLDIRVPKILNGTLQDTFSIDNETKDLDLALTFFGSADALEYTRATYRVYRQAQENGWGARDIGRLFEADSPA